MRFCVKYAHATHISVSSLDQKLLLAGLILHSQNVCASFPPTWCASCSSAGSLGPPTFQARCLCVFAFVYMCVCFCKTDRQHCTLGSLLSLRKADYGTCQGVRNTPYQYYTDSQFSTHLYGCFCKAPSLLLPDAIWGLSQVFAQQLDMKLCSHCLRTISVDWLNLCSPGTSTF